jgi:hypothetical protein
MTLFALCVWSIVTPVSESSAEALAEWVAA